MLAEFPEYREDKGQVLPQARHVWTYRHPSSIWFHLLLVIDPSFDKFTVEAGWGLDGVLPQFSYDGADGIFERPILFRMNFIWSGEDYWWPLVLRPEEFERAIRYRDDPIEQCLPLAGPAVTAAAQKLKEHWVPTAEKIVQMHGKKN
jgi:hypothetical protein